MKRFARIIELPESQFLLTVETDDYDEIKLKLTMDLGGVTASISCSGKYESYDSAIADMDEFQEDKAARLYQNLKNSFFADTATDEQNKSE